MPAGNFKETHDKILKSGLELFLENGYERTNLREVCKRAGITTGAFYRHFADKHSLFAELVNPVIKGIDDIYKKCGNTFYSIIDSEVDSEEIVETFIDFLYENFALFKLLLECSDGTAFVDFIDFLAIKEDATAKNLYNNDLAKGIELHVLNENEIHMLNHAYFACIFEVVLHNYPKDKALQYAKTVQSFFSAGWKEAVQIR